MLLFEDHSSLDRPSIVYALAFSPDGSQLASGARDGSVCIRNSTGIAVRLSDLSPEPTTIHALAFLSETLLAIGSERGWECYRQVESAGWQRGGPSSSVPTTSLAVLSDGLIAVGSGERFKSSTGSFEIYDWKQQRRREPFFRETYGVRTVATVPAKMLAAWATGHKELKVWDVRRQTPLRFPLAHTSASIALAPDGSTVAAAQDWTIRLLDLALKQDRAILKGHKGIVSAVAFSPDSTTIATGSWDGTVRLWDAATGQERAVFQWPIGKVYSLIYAPDGLRLAAGGDRGAIVVWDVD